MYGASGFKTSDSAGAPVPGERVLFVNPDSTKRTKVLKKELYALL